MKDVLEHCSKNTELYAIIFDICMMISGLNQIEENPNFTGNPLMDSNRGAVRRGNTTIPLANEIFRVLLIDSGATAS